MSEASPAPCGEFLLYESEDGRTRVECRFLGDSLWHSQLLMAELFQVSIPTINEHLKTLYADGEIQAEDTIRKFLVVRPEGSRRVSRQIEHYSLDALLAVGFRVRSARGTQFRRWATERLGEYLVKGFTIDDERLKNPPVDHSEAPDRFGELLERIRDIRASERRMYLRVREIFALAADYVPSLPETAGFFQLIQNKLHYAVAGQTASEIIHARADHGEPNMGLRSTRNGPVQKADIGVAENYLIESEIVELNRIASMWLDFAEDQATRRKEVFLKNWAERLDDFLKFNELSVLAYAGKVSHQQAIAHAHYEYEKFAAQRRANLELAGEAYACRMISRSKEDEKALEELGSVIKRYSTNKGGRDAS